ncbi:MAG: hypothetical protein ISQ34_02985 [Rickettsiales bacterium]|nr:hypothetical protein [Rickettsiales bacterium]
MSQTSCYQGRVDPFDIQNGLSRKDIKDSIVKQPEGVDRNKKLLNETPIPNTSRLIVTPSPPVIGGDKVVSFSVTSEVPLKDVLIELGRVAQIDVDIDPRVSGGVIINAQNKSLKEVIDRIATQGKLRYSFNNDVLFFEPDTPYMKNYFVDYLTSGGLWGEVETNINTILTNSEIIPSEGQAIIGSAASISTNKSAGIITVFATDNQHEAVKEYLDDVHQMASAQVLIEAKIVEVNLNEKFYAGINWNLLAASIDGVASIPSAASAGGISSSGISLFGSNLSASVAALGTFGTTRTIASPRLHAINNQSASLNFGDTIVYFKIDANQDVTTTTDSTSNNTTTITTTKEELDIGTQLEITPSINAKTKEITLSVKPTLSVRGEDVIDPASSTQTYTDTNGDTQTLLNSVPQVNTRTIETIAKIKSGEVLVIGGLMRDDTTNTDSGVPWLADIPVIGWLFKSSSKETSITETVIFIKATIIEEGNTVSKIDGDLQRKFDSNRRRFFNSDAY